MSQVKRLLERWFAWRCALYPEDGAAISPVDQATLEFKKATAALERELTELMARFEGEVPKFSPRYVGHMFSELSLAGLLGHWVALLHNPNNIARESSQVGVTIEQEAIAAIARMVGYDERQARGHFTSGGTVANIEAALRARTFLTQVTLGGAPSSSPVILAPATCHYSWSKAAFVLGLGADSLWLVPIDRLGRMDLDELEDAVARAKVAGRPIMMVVTVAGSTELGQFDPIDRVADLLDRHAQAYGDRIWHHVDAAYGGYFCSIGWDGESRASDSMSAEDAEVLRDALLAIRRAESVTLDPHKLGYIPYSCGVFMARSCELYSSLTDDVPYVKFTEQDPGPYTLEGSRSATGAAATWLAARTMGLTPEGYGRVLGRTLAVRHDLETNLKDLSHHLPWGIRVAIAPGCVTNVLCFALVRAGERLRQSNDRTRAFYRYLAPGSHGPFTVTHTTLHMKQKGTYVRHFAAQWTAMLDEDHVELVRMCLINPFFSSKEMRVSFSELFVATLRAWIDSAVTGADARSLNVF